LGKAAKPGRGPQYGTGRDTPSDVRGPDSTAIYRIVGSVAAFVARQTSGRVVARGISGVRVLRRIGAGHRQDVPAGWQKELLKAGFAITHDKIVVIDPFADDCVVVTGSHNLGYQASYNNDENIVMIEGNKKLAMAYATHVLDVHDHFSWRWTVNHGTSVDANPRDRLRRSQARKGSAAVTYEELRAHSIRQWRCSHQFRHTRTRLLSDRNRSQWPSVAASGENLV